MVLKKGEFLLVIVLGIALFFSLSATAQTDPTGYCANPLITDQRMCSNSPSSVMYLSECCPAESDLYSPENDGYPKDQSDCQQNYFSISGRVESKCGNVCCYIETAQVCVPYRYVSCLNDGGTPSAYAECSEAASGDLPECVSGCCCFRNVLGGQVNSMISTESYCSEQVEHLDWDSDTVSEVNCEAYCDVITNDGDGDGVPDSIDKCPGEQGSYVNNGCPEGEVAGCGDVPDCAGGSIVSDCCCAGELCDEGSYCCENGCSPVECGTRCEYDIPNGEVDENGCPLFRICQPDGSYSDHFMPKLDCMVKSEICNNNIDDNDDGLMNCDENYCDGKVCASSDDQLDQCMSKYYFSDGVYRCCSDQDVNDCNEDGIADTCGSCKCLEVRAAPKLMPIEIFRGRKDVRISWLLDCPGVDFNVYKCEGECSSGQDYNLVYTTDDNEFLDSDIKPMTWYFYRVEARYPQTEDMSGTSKTSEVVGFRSGHELCMTIPDRNFCTDESYGFAGPLVMRVACDSHNNLTEVSRCGEDEICMGPFSNKQTRCVYVDECTNCGTPFNMFSDEQSTIYEGGSLCSVSDTCYLDYTDTVPDAYKSCINIGTCHEYRSMDACEGDPDSVSNNKCLTRDCEWMDTGDDLGSGLCMETKDYLNTCDMCHVSEHNGVFGSCDYERCKAFGDCYLRPDTGRCVEGSQVSCEDYATEEQCTGGRELQIDVQYDEYGDERISGTNRILQKSADEMGVGLCRWEPAWDVKCFKDADGNMQRDGLRTNDRTPPKTIIINHDKLQDLNISFIVTDYNAEGIPGTGVDDGDVFFCIVPHGSSSCYPDKSIYDLDGEFNGQRGKVKFGGGTGKYDLYFYSIDKARNMEEVKMTTLDVDLSAPTINVSHLTEYDTITFEKSNITFIIRSSESVSCTDELRVDKDNIRQNLRGTYWDDYFEARFLNLDDGVYVYKVRCTDSAGNVAEVFHTVRIEADVAAYGSRPYGRIDHTDVELSIMTQDYGTCYWSEDVEEDIGNMKKFDSTVPSDSDFLHSADILIDDVSGAYSYDVKCFIDSLNRVSDDEIEFVYDHTAPFTELVNADGTLFNIGKLYAIDDLPDKIFLKCSDEPENGFGCNITRYCVAYGNSYECDPDKDYDPGQPVEIDGTTEDEVTICFYSTENIENDMGGLRENTTCFELNADTQAPSFQDLNVWDNDPLDSTAQTVYDDTFILSGKVIDEDALGGHARNELSITVGLYGGGVNQSYDLILNGADFSQEITLQEGFNEITLIASDRSGMSTGVYKYYVLMTPYEGKKIFLKLPLHGVSEYSVFDIEIETYKKARNCRVSPNSLARYENSDDMARASGDLRWRTKIDVSGLAGDDGSVDDIPVYVFCKFSDFDITREVFNVSVDSSRPVILADFLDRTNNGDPPVIVEKPIMTNLVVKTDDMTRCRYTFDASMDHLDFYRMSKFDNYDIGFNFTNKVMFDNQIIEDGKDYTVFFYCENKVGKLTKRKSIYFRVNSDLETAITLLNPKSPTKETTFPVSVRVTKAAEYCKAGFEADDLEPMTKINDYEFVTPGSVTLSLGRHTLYVACLTDNFNEDRAEFNLVVDTSPPVFEYVDDGNVTKSNSTLSATWKAEDNESDIDLYVYSIGTAPHLSDVFNWTETSRESGTASNLDLEAGRTYYWSVRARNTVGLWSDVYSSDGIAVTGDGSFIVPAFDSCSDGKLNNDETDIDCGGSKCDPCGYNDTCILNDDCLSRNCADGLCQAPTCEDNIKNQDETGIDCGGSCDGCPEGFDCSSDDDCETGYCYLLKCTEPSCDDGVKNGLEDGIDCGEVCGNECPEPGKANYTEIPGGCIIDNVPESHRYYGAIDRDCDGMADDWELLFGLNATANDADLDPDGDGILNIDEFIAGTDPGRAESGSTDQPEKTGILMIVLMFVLFFVFLFAILYLIYEQLYNRLPPGMTNFVDSNIIDPMKSFFTAASDAVKNVLRKTPLKKYIRETKPTGSMYSSVVPPDYRGGVVPAVRGRQKKLDMSKTPPRMPKKIRIDDNKYKEVSSTKEMIKKIREKRLEEKRAERRRLIEKFESKTDKPADPKSKKRRKRKELLKKVNESFGDDIDKNEEKSG